jgi:MFS family permease
MIAGLKTTTVAIIGDSYRGGARNKVIGWQGAAFKMTGVAFLLLGGFMADLYWRVPYLGYILALLIVPSALIALRETMPSASLPAARPVNSPSKASSDLPFLQCAIVFVSAVLGSGFFFITLVQLPFFLGESFAARPFQMGAAIAVGNTVGGITALFYGRIRAKFNYAGIYSLNFLSLAVGYYVLTLAPSY